MTATTSASAADTITIHHDVVNEMAAQLRDTPPELSPLHNADVYRTLSPEGQAAVHAAVPQLTRSSGVTLATEPITMNTSPLDAIPGYEAPGMIDPRSGMMRLPQARLEVCGSAALVLSNLITQGSMKWKPQRDFKGVRLVIPSGEDTGSFLSNLLVGNKPIYLGTGNEPAENFSELSSAGFVDFPVCRAGIEISATFSNTTLAGATTFYSALLGFVIDGKFPEPLKGYLRRMAIPPQVVAAGAAFQYALNPQDALKVRKLAVENTAAPSFILTQVSIGNEPQLLSGDPIPAQAFADRATGVWVDWDRCKTGQQIFLSVTNVSAAPATFQGSLLGDIDESQS